MTKKFKEIKKKPHQLTTVTSSPCTDTSGLRKWHRATIPAMLAASVMLPSWFNRCMSSRICQTWEKYRKYKTAWFYRSSFFFKTSSFFWAIKRSSIYSLGLRLRRWETSAYSKIPTVPDLIMTKYVALQHNLSIILQGPRYFRNPTQTCKLKIPLKSDVWIFNLKSALLSNTRHRPS